MPPIQPNPSPQGPLHGVQVLESVSPDCPLPLRLAISFAARLAAGMGAKVHGVGAQPDDPLQAIGPQVAGTSALARFLQVGKTPLTDGARPEPGAAILRLARLPTIVMCDEQAQAQLGEGALGSVRTVFSLFPHAVNAPPLPASEFTIMASTGLLDLVGDPGRAPLRMGGHQLAFSCGLAAYGGAIAALSKPANADGSRELVRVSLADVAVWLNWKSVAMASWSSAGRTRMGRDAEWQVVRCADGWVALVFLEADWPLLRAFVDDPLLCDPRYDSRAERRKDARIVSQRIEAAFLRYSRRELKDLSLAKRLPLGPVWTPVELESDPQNVARNFLERRPIAGASTTVLMPRLPVLWNGQALGSVAQGRA